MKKIAAKLSEHDIVEVKPMSAPINNLFYIDFKYTSLADQKRKNRKEKYKKLFDDDKN